MGKFEKIPQHVAIIMDGNRRWARQHGKTIIQGHRAGYKAAERVSEYALDLGVKELTYYTFSTENWSRSESEVTGLMNLMRWILKERIRDLDKKNIQLHIIGGRDRLPADLVRLIDAAEKQTVDNTRGRLNLLINYGGRADIVHAAQALVNKQETVTEESLARHLWTTGMRDVDLVIRTSECRLSNFLPWETVYAEIYFKKDIFWPDFDEAEFDKALAFYNGNDRRFGG